MPLVLLPGMNCSADLWEGTGLDGIAPRLGEPAMDAQVGRLLTDLPDRFTLVGLSLGAIVAMALAVRAPERVAGLCVMSANAKAPTRAQRDGWREWRSRLDDGVSARRLQETILGGLLSERGRRDRSLVERTLAMGDAVGERRLRAQLALQATRVDLLARLPELEMPALVLSGIADTVCPPAFHDEIATRLPLAETGRVDGGHLLPMERPGEVGAAVDAWRSQHAI